MLKKTLMAAFASVALLAGCNEDDAKVASANIMKAADNFEIQRRVVFYNGFTDTYILTVEGRCSMDLNANATAYNVICKTGPKDYIRHTLILSDNTSAFVEQTEAAAVSAYHYRVTFKPQSIIGDIDFRGSMEELTTNSSEANQ